MIDGCHDEHGSGAGARDVATDTLRDGRRDGMPLSPDDVGEIVRDSWDVLEMLGVFEMTRWAPGPVTAGGREFARAMLRV